MNIIPAILPHSFEEVSEKLARVEGVASHVQIDLCDGVFGREKTWLPLGNETLPTGFSYEFDIMLIDWKPYLMRSLLLGATSIVAHVDNFTDEDIEYLVTTVSARQVPLGISVSNDKSVEVHAENVRKVQALYPKVFIQVMGIRKIGEQGQFFDEEAVARVQNLKQQFGSMKVQVDGGLKPEQAKKMLEAGADSLAVGSFIFRNDAAEAIAKLQSITLDSAVV